MLFDYRWELRKFWSLQVHNSFLWRLLSGIVSIVGNYINSWKIMTVKETWTNKDFESMGWHDCHIYSMDLPDENLVLSLDIDYIFKWELEKGRNLYEFWISPCTLTFENVLNLKISIDLTGRTGIDIEDIERTEPGGFDNAQVLVYLYTIKVSNGLIQFNATGFKQTVRRQPVLSKSQLLGRAGFERSAW